MARPKFVFSVEVLELVLRELTSLPVLKSLTLLGVYFVSELLEFTLLLLTFVLALAICLPLVEVFRSELDARPLKLVDAVLELSLELLDDVFSLDGFSLEVLPVILPSVPCL